MDATRSFEFTYSVLVGPVEASGQPIDVYLPLPIEDGHQKVLSLEIDAPIEGRIASEPAYGNRFWHGRIEGDLEKPIEIILRARVDRSGIIDQGEGAEATPPSEADLRRYLGPNERVVVGDEILDPILEEIRGKVGEGDQREMARAIYDWVVDNVEYKKVGTGWGNGDSFWACNERYGNCTDFHALFISLARTEGIPARFEIGFPVPDDRTSGEISGYHCWVQFYLPETGWFPIDASEAFKHPEKRDLLFGSQPPDRIHFTTGRDLRLGQQHRGQPLNYFVYPYFEAGGEVVELPLKLRFSYRDFETGSRD